MTLLAPRTAPTPPPARGPLFALHVTLNTLAYAAFALSFALSLIYLIQNRVLRARRPGLVFWRFPALDVLERMSRKQRLGGLASLGAGSFVRICVGASPEWGDIPRRIRK